MYTNFNLKMKGCKSDITILPRTNCMRKLTYWEPSHLTMVPRAAKERTEVSSIHQILSLEFTVLMKSSSCSLRGRNPLWHTPGIKPQLKPAYQSQQKVEAEVCRQTTEQLSPV